MELRQNMNVRRKPILKTVLILIFSTAFSAYSQTLTTSESADLRPRAINQVSYENVDQVDPHSGNLTIKHQDLVLPGNGGMDIVVWRAYNMQSQSAGLTATHSHSYRWTALGIGWELGVAPRLSHSNSYHSTPYGFSYRASQLLQLCSGTAFRHVDRGSLMLELPNGDQQPLYSTGGYRAISKQNWKVECVSNVVSATSPDGVIYNFGNVTSDRHIGRFFVGLHPGSPPPPSHSDSYMLAKTATDIHGNILTFTYQTIGTPIRPWVMPGISSSPLGSSGHSLAPFEKPSVLLSSVVANDGRSVSFSYNSTSGRLTSITDNTGRSLSYSYLVPDSLNAEVLSSVTLPTGLKWSYAYAPGTYQISFDRNMAPIQPLNQSTITSRKLISLTYPTGGIVSYEYGFYNLSCCTQVHSRGERVVKRTLSSGASWSYNYTRGTIGQYDLTTVTGPEGVTTYRHMGPGYSIKTSGSSYQNNAWQIGQLMEKADPNGNKETNIWQQREILNSPTIFYELGTVSDERIWAADLKSKTITRDGATHTTTYSNYDAYGNPGMIVEVGPNGGNRVKVFTYLNDTTKWIIGKPKDLNSTIGLISHTYDTKGNLLSITDNGVTTSYTYDSQGNLTTKTLPRGLVHQYSNYKRGIPQTETQPEGITIYRVVDNAGNVTSITNGEGKTTTYTYDGLNRVTSETYPLGFAKNIVYTPTTKTATRGSFVETTVLDGFGLVSSITSGGIKTTFNYDALGRKIFESYPNITNGTSYSYDALSRPTRITNADGSYQSYIYGAGSVSVTNERNYTTTYHYRSYGNPDEQHLVKIDAPDPSASVFIDRNARDLINLVTQAGLTRAYVYNTNYYLTSVYNPETGTTTYGRDAAGNMRSSKVGNSETTYYVYDGQNRLTQVSQPDGTTVTHTYNKLNELLTSNASGGNRGFGYDANGNLTHESLQIGGVTYTLNFAYNSNDHLSSITYPISRRVVNYAPDVLGRPTQVSGYVNSVSYWPSGLIRQIDYANGTVTQYDQNTRLWPDTFKTFKSGAGNYFSSIYGYDGVGNLTSITDSVDGSFNRSLSYDSIDRLTGATGPWGSGSINYNAAGNITRQSLGNWNLNYSYSSNNLLSSVSGSRIATYDHDIYGNISSGGGNTYSYNANSNLKCINCNLSNAISFTYDGINQRSSIARNNGAVTYEMYNSKGLLMLEEHAYGQPYRAIEYIYLDSKRIAEQEGDKVSYFHNDISGSPMLATDSSGAQLWKQTYRPYGDKVNQNASTTNKIGFHGKPYDSDVGLSYMGARYYDPTLGRFTSIDPVDFQENNLHSFNRYAYANNNPYKYVDPDGRLPFLLIPVITFIAKEVAAEVASHYTGGATDFLSTRRMGTKAGQFAVNKLSAAVQDANKEIGSKATSQLAKNKAAGEAFEQKVMGQVQQTQSGVVQQVTVKTKSGVKTRIDIMGRDSNGNIVCTECKASSTAPLTKNQKAAFPEIQQSGATVVGEGKPGFPGGTQIPPTKIDIVRP